MQNSISRRRLEMSSPTSVLGHRDLALSYASPTLPCPFRQGRLSARAYKQYYNRGGKRIEPRHTIVTLNNADRARQVYPFTGNRSIRCRSLKYLGLVSHDSVEHRHSKRRKMRHLCGKKTKICYPEKGITPEYSRPIESAIS